MMRSRGYQAVAGDETSSLYLVPISVNVPTKSFL
jgi:hypothetical protein